MATVRPSALPAATSVGASNSLIIDDGITVQKATPQQIASAAPFVRMAFETIADLSFAQVPASIDLVRVDGYTAAGDGGAALWKRAAVQSAGNCKRQSADGAWWELAEAIVTPEMLGGTSAAIAELIAVKRNVQCSSAGEYDWADLALSHSQSIIGNDAIVTADTGATNIVTLAGASPRLSDVRINDNANSSGPAIAFKTSRYATVTNVAMVNAYDAISFENDGATGCNLARLTNVDAEQITGTGVSIGSSVSEIRWVNGHLNGKVNYSAGLGKPEVGSIGWRQNTPNLGLARGGHQFTGINCIGLDTGYYFTDAELTVFASSIADSLSGYAIDMDGACSKIKFVDFFCGFNAGIRIGGTSANILFDGLETYNVGSIPSWGQAGWYEVAGPYYDLTVADTASVVVRGWQGSKRISVASGAKLIVDDGDNYEGKSVGTVAAGATVYLGVQDDSATEADVQWRAPYDCYILRLQATVGTAPGAGETFTYTARVDGVDTALVQTITGAGVFGGVDTWAGSLVPVSKGESISIKLVTSATASSARHGCILQVAPR